MRWFRITAFVEGIAEFVGVFSSSMHGLKQFQAFYFSGSAHIMTLICIKLLYLIDLAIWPFQLDLLAKIINLRRIALLHDDLYHMFPLKLAISEHWHELDDYLNQYKPYFLAIVEINSWMYSFNEMLKEQLEVVAFLTFEQQALHCSLTILNSEVDGSSLGIEE